ncbi:MAG: exodeoxyribonuclease IX, partial [Pseudoxanthomonas sp.]
MAVRLREQREHALLWRQLATIALDAPVDGAEPDFVRGGVDAGMLEALSDSLRFGPMTRRRLREAAGLPG